MLDTILYKDLYRTIMVQANNHMKEKINKLRQEKKQKLTAALQEIGMTINEVKGWLCDVSEDYQETASQDHSYQNKFMKDLFKNIQYVPYKSKTCRQYSDAINRLYDDIKDVNDNEPIDTTCVTPKSNVTFVPGTLQNETLLLVGGVQVLGDYKLNYTYNTLEKKGILQVEFIDPI